MTTYLQQLKDQIAPAKAEITRLHDQLSDARKASDKASRFSSRMSGALYDLKNIDFTDHDSDPVLGEVKSITDRFQALFEQSENDKKKISVETEALREELRKKESDEISKLEEKIKIMERNNITSDIIEIFNAIIPAANTHYDWVSSPSNYKQQHLIYGLNHDRLFRKQLEQGSTRKLKKIYEVGFKDSTLNLAVLDLTTKMMKWFTIKDNDDVAHIQLFSYDNKTESFQKLCVFPDIPKDKLLPSFLSEV